MNYELRLTSFTRADAGQLPEEFEFYLCITKYGTLFPCVWEEGSVAKEHAPEGAFYDGIGGHAAIEDYIVAWKGLSEADGIEFKEISDEEAAAKPDMAQLEPGQFEVIIRGFSPVDEDIASKLEGMYPYLLIDNDNRVELGFWEDWYDGEKGGFFDGIGGHFFPETKYTRLYKKLDDEATPGIYINGNN